MNTAMAKFWFVVSLVLGAVLVAQTLNHKKLTAQQASSTAQAKEQELTLAAAKARADETERALRRAQDDLTSVRQELANQRANPAAVVSSSPAQPAAPAAPGAEGKSPMSMIGDMLKNPEMRKMMESQQKASLEMMYDPLLKELGLTPEQSAELKRILLDRQMKSVGQAGELMNAAATNRTELQREMAEMNQAREEEIKTLLGEENYAQYQEYNQTLGERMALNQFTSQTPLQPEQREQLLTIMREEKQSLIAVQPDVADPTRGAEMLQSEEAMQRHFAQQEQVNASVLERSRALLSPEQHQALQAFQKSQQNLQRMGLEMARKMMQPQAVPAPAP